MPPRSLTARKFSYFFGVLIGLIAPQSLLSHLPAPSMVMVSGLPCTVLFIAIFME